MGGKQEAEAGEKGLTSVTPLQACDQCQSISPCELSPAGVLAFLLLAAQVVHGWQPFAYLHDT